MRRSSTVGYLCTEHILSFTMLHLIQEMHVVNEKQNKDKEEEAKKLERNLFVSQFLVKQKQN